MVEIFKYFTIKETLISVCLVFKRWQNISNISVLWRHLPLDVWNIEYLEENHFINIITHSTGFVYFSLNHIKVEGPKDRMIIALENSLACASKLVFLDLSGQHLCTVDFLLKGTVPPLECLVLDDCKDINLQSLATVVKKMRKLTRR